MICKWCLYTYCLLPDVDELLLNAKRFDNKWNYLNKNIYEVLFRNFWIGNKSFQFWSKSENVDIYNMSIGRYFKHYPTLLLLSFQLQNSRVNFASLLLRWVENQKMNSTPFLKRFTHFQCHDEIIINSINRISLLYLKQRYIQDKWRLFHNKSKYWICGRW